MKIQISSLVAVTIATTTVNSYTFNSAFAFSPSIINTRSISNSKQKYSLVTTTSSTSLYSTSYLQSLSQKDFSGINVQQSQPQQQAVTTTSSSNNSTGRRTIVAGNWKLNPSSKEEAISLLNGLKAGMTNHHNDDNVEVVIFPPLPFHVFARMMFSGN